MKSDADLQVKLTRQLAQAERFDELLTLASNPADNISEKQQGEIWFLSGMAYSQLGQTQKSLNLMRREANIKNSRGQANSWIGFLEENLKSSQG